MDKLYEAIIRKYKCCICGYLLSKPPIMTSLLEIDEALHKCGRCKLTNLDEHRWNRNHLFEEVAQFLYFPCSYTTCKKKIPWDEVEEHEKNCLHKTIKCPLSKYCECFELIPVDQIGEHFKDKHDENIITADMMAYGWEAYSKCNYIFLIQIENEHFFVYIQQGTRIAVLATRSTKYVKFNVKLKISSKNNFTVSFYDLPVVLYDHDIMCTDVLLNNNEKGEANFNNFTNNLANELLGNADSFCGKLRYYIRLIPDEIVTEDADQLTEEEDEREKNKILNFRVHCSDDDSTYNKLYEVIKKYKCCVCGLLLSVPPIMVSNLGKDNQVYKCGRCEGISLETYRWIRNDLFEKVAWFLHFPCSYFPCMERIPWGRVQEHEINCQFKTIKCPLSNECKSFEEIPVHQIGKHVTNIHNRTIETNDTMVNGLALNPRDDYLFLLQIKHQYFFLYILKGNRIALLATRLGKYTRFNVKLKLQPEDNFAVSFNDLPVVLYDVKYHCTSCIYDTCSETHYTYLKTRKRQTDIRTFTNDLNNEVTRNLFCNNGILRYYITLIADDKIEEHEKEDEKIPPQINVETVRRALNCPYCMKYMTPPIFTCATGHTICNECRPRLKECPTCKAYFRQSRNYALEDMSNELELPCQFNMDGCTFVGSVSQMYNHELKCSYNDFQEKIFH
ncbi:uncharacterized protein LOC108911434 [Anoplophora glabripennis]|uniref:uncharacterized protein LOC108911434 n=1 Tax=Anoplophora glabripennis TaxID=217634 RepID=UPI000874F597|nr:uncharacterized protein LOC108911434 [Anoplophora glabripennis]